MGNSAAGKTGLSNRRALDTYKETDFTVEVAANRFTDDELKTEMSLLPIQVWCELGFGSWILLQPDLINSHAQAVIRSLRDDERKHPPLARQNV